MIGEGVWTIALRLFAAVLVSVLVVVYSIGVVTGRIPTGQRLDPTDLALIVLAVGVVAFLIQPAALTRLSRLKVGGVELSLLESKVEDISLVVPLLFPETERRHLLNLLQAKTAHYEGNDAVRREVRRLRSIGLIISVKPVGNMRDGLHFDLSEFVRLTTLGRRWAEEIRRMDDAHVRAEHDTAGA